MKRTLILAWLTGLLLEPLGAQEAPSVEARLTQSNGDITLASAQGTAEGQVIRGELPLAEGDRIKVGPGSSAEISVEGRTLIQLEEGSVFRLKQLSPQRIVFGLDQGTLLAKVNFDKHAGAQLSVETPSAVVAVRGTEFVVQQENSGSQVGVLDEGHVAVRSPGSSEEVMLHFNQETRVRYGQLPERAQTLEHLYHYKLQMGQMRTRLRLLHKHWNALRPSQRNSVRRAWLKTHARSRPVQLRQRRSLTRENPPARRPRKVRRREDPNPRPAW